MKKYVNKLVGSCYWMGNGVEIKAVYKSIVRAYFKASTDLHPLYFKDIEFSPDELYGLCVDEDFNCIEVINEDNMINMIYSGTLVYPEDIIEFDDEFDDEFDFDLSKAIPLL